MTFVLFSAGVLLVATLTAAAAALRSVNRMWLREWVEARLAGDASATLSIDGVQNLLLAVGTAVALVAFATCAVLGVRWAEHPQLLIERVLLAAAVVLVAGQLIPRALGRRWAAAFLPRVEPLLKTVSALLSPLVRPAHALAGAMLGRGAASPSAPPGEREALDELLREGDVEGVGDAGESAIISGVVEFTEKHMRDVMTPRAQIFSIERNVPEAELAAQVAQVKYSRVPITDGGVDRVVGMVHAFDVLKWEAGSPWPLRPVVFARESLVANELLSKLLRSRVHLAIVQDAAGRTVGLVTLEDLLEELVGEIRDEHDEPASAS